MILLAAILTLLLVGALDALNIFKTYQAIPDENDDLADNRNSESIADSYELLGLIILDYNPISRRDNLAVQTNLTKAKYDANEDNGNGIEPRSQNKQKKKRNINSNDNPKHKHEEKSSLKILGYKKQRIVEQKLIELIKQKLKPINSDTKRKIEMFNEAQNRKKENLEDHSFSNRYKVKKNNELTNNEAIHLNDYKKRESESSKESIVEKTFKKNQRHYNDEDEDDDPLRKQKKNKHKYFDVDTEMKESSEERERQVEKKVKKIKKVEVSGEVETPFKPKRLDVKGKDYHHSNEFDRNVKLKKKKAQSKDGTEEEDRKGKKGFKNKDECINETESNIDKCVRACQRTHEDVCDLLKCSQRSVKALRNECTVSCKKVFPILCA
ncbi:DNA ligase 1-like [Spodoptera frugiperda]|uniref:DNA ligase 1-like n=1 Tax=Spodoptera frugiperda TaxID=7108 RepID=A0A9R0DZS0_SPOFR|nr:DNA ligase 1-like [Spodoptera frugiperda]